MYTYLTFSKNIIIAETVYLLHIIVHSYGIASIQASCGTIREV